MIDGVHLLYYVVFLRSCWLVVASELLYELFEPLKITQRTSMLRRSSFPTFHALRLKLEILLFFQKRVLVSLSNPPPHEPLKQQVRKIELHIKFPFLYAVQCLFRFRLNNIKDSHCHQYMYVWVLVP